MLVHGERIYLIDFGLVREIEYRGRYKTGTLRKNRRLKPGECPAFNYRL